MMLATTCLALLSATLFRSADLGPTPFPMEPVPEFVFPARIFDVSRYGAVADGRTCCTAAFQQAIDDCARQGGGTVVVPKGVYFATPIRLRSNVEFHLDEGATVEFTDDPKDCLPAVMSSWEGLECLNYSPMVYAFGCTNVALTGKGTLQARMTGWRKLFDEGRTGIQDARRILYTWGSTDVPVAERDITRAHPAVLRPQLVQFNRSRNVRIEDIELKDSPFWTLHLLQSENVVVRRLRTNCHGFNNDGIDIEMTRNVLIEDCTIVAGDDGFVLKAGRNRDGWRVGRPTENVVIRDCKLPKVSSLFAVGSEMSAGVRNVWIHDCEVGTTCSAMYVKTNRRRGGFVRNILVENVSIESALRLFAIETDVLYQWAAFPEYERRLTDISGITLRNIRCSGAGCGLFVVGDAGRPVDGLTVENVVLDRVENDDRVIRNATNVEVRGFEVRGHGLVDNPWVNRYRPGAYAPPPPYSTREAWTFRADLARPEPPFRFVADESGLGSFWVSNRISRCYFSPIKRPPLNRDELMDDVDYYPEEYLARLQREGVNGLWLTVEWRDLAETSFTRRSPDADRRLAKLRQVVERCLKYGIKTWLFCIEPRACRGADSLLIEHPELFGSTWADGKVFCPLSAATQRYVEESVRDIFTRVPRLGGIMMISHGERMTTCLSKVDAVTGKWTGDCPRCAQARPWQMHEATAAAIMRGIRAAGSDAGYVSWFYMPYVRPERADWVAECAAHLPKGVTLACNFESGLVVEQLGRPRCGGDYWQAQVGPAEGFRKVAEAGRRAQAPIGAKIQVCNSHEVATVPYVPVPGLLYRKYRAMKEFDVSTVIQCWYFGSYPGLMNAAAGMLSRERFLDDETAFLTRLAKPYWGEDAARMAELWKRFSDAYANYPLSNCMQYYGPFHAGVAWPLLPDVWMLPLGRTWKPQDPPSGDVIGECLENHSLEEARELALRMAAGMRIVDATGREAWNDWAARWADDRERRLDLGVMQALHLQCESAADIFSFYLDRAQAIYDSRVRGDSAAALAALARMAAIVSNEVAVTRKLLPLARADSRLGFHSEAEAHQYHPAKLEWRLQELERTRLRLSAIVDDVRHGRPYPLSAHERAAPVCSVGGDWTETEDGLRFKVRAEASGDLTFSFVLRRPRPFTVSTIDAAGVTRYKSFAVAADGTVSIPSWFNAKSEDHRIRAATTRQIEGTLCVDVTLAAAGWGERADRRPGWIQIADGYTSIWPAIPNPDAKDGRLNLSPFCARIFGRLDYK